MTPEMTNCLRRSKRCVDTRAVSQLERISQEKATAQPLFLDMRAPSLFARGFIPGSINVPSMDCLAIIGSRSECSGQSVYVIASSALKRQGERRLVERYSGIQVHGWLKPEVVREWSRTRGDLATIEELEPDRLAVRVAAWKTVVLDVREESAFAQAHIPEALHIPLDNISHSVAGLPERTSISVVCETGEKAGFAGSLLSRLGYGEVAILRGGFRAYVDARLPIARRNVAKR